MSDYLLRSPRRKIIGKSLNFDNKKPTCTLGINIPNTTMIITDEFKIRYLNKQLYPKYVLCTYPQHKPTHGNNIYIEKHYLNISE